MPPGGDPITTFKAVIGDFNDARNVGDYREFLQYLHPTSQILVQKVDDPGDFVVKPRDGIIGYLNTTQAQTKSFPQFYFNVRFESEKTHKS